MTDLIRQHIETVAKYERDIEAQEKAILADYEAKGHRITSGGQVDHDTWDVTDYRTGETILEGGGGFEGYVKALEKHGEMWVHIDPITEELYDAPVPVTEGLPELLCQKLSEWVEVADPDEIAMVLGED